ncbi:MAG: DNA replication and repair protein RecF [Bacteroidetes bacterium]|nr:DNA replication and repair protein RecF [Bacteroidota bacterium]
MRGKDKSIFPATCLQAGRNTYLCSSDVAIYGASVAQIPCGMYCRSIQVNDFKNYPSFRVEFIPGFNCLTGKNGSGKTNLLDAVHYLSFCKSFINPIDQQNIRHTCDTAILQGEFMSDSSSENIFCSFRKGTRKIFKRNGREYDRLADHIGLIPLVTISPEDAVIITGGSEERRRFMDTVISQFDKIYLDNLLRYNKALEHRNRVLKEYHSREKPDELSLEIWNEKMIPLAEYVFAKRKKFIEDLVHPLQTFYSLLCNTEEISVQYVSQLEKSPLAELFARSLQRDLALEFTSSGTHKDDLLFHLDEYPLKKFGSQGQQKTFVIALKLAVLLYLHRQTGRQPILLLDDIFAQLDAARVTRLMQILAGDNKQDFPVELSSIPQGFADQAGNNPFGQIVITDTSNEVITDIVSEVTVPIRIIEIENNNIIRIADFPVVEKKMVEINN